MPPAASSIERLVARLRLHTPIIAVYDAAPGEIFEPIVKSTGRTCCFAYLERWLKGETLVIERGEGDFGDPDAGCMGAQAAFGLRHGYPPFMANFLTDGKGAPMGEGLKARPELAQDFLDRSVPPPLAGSTVLIGPLWLEAWESVRSVTFLVDPDRLSALMTLAAYWTSDPDVIYAPFSSGCGLMWRELEAVKGKRALIGCTDIAMRKHLPPDMLCFTISPSRFEKMVDFPDDAFLNKDWWNELMDLREKQIESGP